MKKIEAAYARKRHLYRVVQYLKAMVYHFDDYSCELADDYDNVTGVAWYDNPDVCKFFDGIETACEGLAQARDAAERLLQAENRVIDEYKAVFAND